jgi:hypothetical protein
LLDVAQQNFRDGRDKYAGYDDPRYALLKSHAPVGYSLEPEDVGRFLFSKETKK